MRQTGEAVFDENGLMKKGVIVRHLLLPGAVKNAKAVVKYVYETYGDTVWLSLMSQYTPLPQVENISPLNRKTTKREYERLLDYTFSLGVTNAFLQEGPVAEESFIPEFDVIVHLCVLVDRFHTCMKIYPPEHTEGASKDGQKGAAQQQKVLEARF